jgi:hypothetical protein
MTEENRAKEICYICGEGIAKAHLSYDHVPPKAFYPKNIRAGLNLQTAPVHKTCNEDYRKDEEYFLHSSFIEVLNQQPAVTPYLQTEFYRRAQKPQTPAIMRKILKECSNVTPGGIHLPAGKYVVQIDRGRIERVVLKIVRGLFYIDENCFLPLKNAKDFRFCLEENEVPELYKLYWPATKLSGAYPKVFSYKYFNTRKYSASGKYPDLDRMHLYTLLFWEAVMFCVAFEDPR